MSLTINAKSCRIFDSKNLSSAHDFIRRNLSNGKRRPRLIVHDSSPPFFFFDKKRKCGWLKPFREHLKSQDDALGFLLSEIDKIYGLHELYDKSLETEDVRSLLDNELSYIWSRISYFSSRLSRSPYFDIFLRLSSAGYLRCGSSHDESPSNNPEFFANLVNLPNHNNLLGKLNALINSSYPKLDFDMINKIQKDLILSRKLIKSSRREIIDEPEIFIEQTLSTQNASNIQQTEPYKSGDPRGTQCDLLCADSHSGDVFHEGLKLSSRPVDSIPPYEKIIQNHSTQICVNQQPGKQEVAQVLCP